METGNSQRNNYDKLFNAQFRGLDKLMALKYTGSFAAGVAGEI